MVKINTLKGYEEVLDIYSIDQEGNVYSEKVNRFLAQGDNGRGYKVVSLKLKGVRQWKKSYIHRIVSLAYIPNAQNKPEVNHIDEDKSNNKICNLEWVTRIENVNHGTGTVRQVFERTEPIYVYDFLLRFIGEYRGMSEATREVLGYRQTKGRNVRIKDYFFLTDVLCVDVIVDINNRSRYQPVVIENIKTNKKMYFSTNRNAREFFDNKVNVTDAIKNNWLVSKKYKIYPIDYNKLKYSPNLQE